jgi:hypothetical protein
MNTTSILPPPYPYTGYEILPIPIKLKGDKVKQFLCSWQRQITILLRRCLLEQLRNPFDTALRLLLSCWIGILTGEACTLPVAPKNCIIV